MRVLQINAIYEKYSTGRTTKELHEALQSLGIESYVACTDIGSLKSHCYQIGSVFERKLHAFFSRVLGNQGYYSTHSTKRLIQFIDDIKPDVIHLRNLHSNYINLPLLLKYIGEKGIATVITLHDCWFFTGKCVYYIEVGCNRWLNGCGKCPALKQGNKSLIFDRSKKMLSDKQKLLGAIRRLAVIGVSQWVTNDASKSILKNASIIRCIYNWIDLEKFHPKDTSSLRKSLGLDGQFVVLGIAMSWNTQKGINIFNELANILPEKYQIILIGDASQLKEKNPKIMFIGTISNTEHLANYYSMADVYVNPTIQETFGKTTAEAMAAGTPVVAYNGTATPELLGEDGSCGFLVDQNSPELYKKHIISVCEKGNSNLSINARARAEQLFEKTANINQYIEVYNSLLQIKEN